MDQTKLCPYKEARPRASLSQYMPKLVKANKRFIMWLSLTFLSCFASQLGTNIALLVA